MTLLTIRGDDDMMHKTLNDAYARSPCAYCKLHKCSLTVKQVKQKECLKKECWHLHKYNHEWWKQRELNKERKKKTKQTKGELTMAEIKTTKNAVEIRSELKKDGTKIEYIVIDGVTCGILGSVNEKDREAALNALNKAYAASNGDIMEMMQKLSTIANIEEKGIEPDEVVEICGHEVILSYANAKAYMMDGTEIASCEDLPTMHNEAIKAVLTAKATVALS